MPNFTIPIQSVDETIKHNILMSVVDRILTILNIKRDDVILQLPYSNNSQPNTQVGVERDLSFGQSRRVFVDADETRAPENLTDRGAGFDAQPPFFHDSQLAIRLHPALARYNYDLTLNIRSASRSEVSMWVNDVHRIASLGGDSFLVGADFHYVIPHPLIALLLDLHASAAHKVNMPSIGEWLKSNFINAVTSANKNFIVRNSLARLLCTIDGAGEITREKQDSGNWMGTLRVKFSVQIPEMIDVYYPPVLNNTLIPSKWWQSMLCPGTSDEAYSTKDAYVTFQDELAPQAPKIEVPVYIPNCDFPQLEKGTRYPGELVLICGYFEMTADEIKSPKIKLFNPTQLGKVKFIPRIYEYLKVAYIDNPDGIDSVYRFYIYENEKQLDRSRNSLDQNLDFWTTKTMSLKDTYQFSATVLTDFRYLSDHGKELLYDYADLIIAIIADFRPDIYNRYDDWWGLLIDGKLPYFIFNDLIDWLSGVDTPGDWTGYSPEALRDPDWYHFEPGYSDTTPGIIEPDLPITDVELINALYSAEQTFHTTSYNRILIIGD